MFLIRDVFRARPGMARTLAGKLMRTIPSMEQVDGFRNCRVMVDAVAAYWTVVLEAECDSLSAFEAHQASFGTRDDVRAALEGYMDLIEGGHREIFRIL